MAGATGGLAAGENLGSFKSWSAISYADGDSVACMVFTQPEKSEGDYSQRGEVYGFVTHRLGGDSLNRVSFETGYTYQESSSVSVAIDNEHYTLTTHGSAAWSDNPDTNARMVRAMRAGRSMVVQGTSSRGTKTTDTYSLYGFSAAHKAINRACKVNP